MSTDAPTFTRWLSCPDCRSELWLDWHGPDLIFTQRHSVPCPRWAKDYREVRLVLEDAAPERLATSQAAE